jgi:prevent-host-death family protein
MPKSSNPRIRHVALTQARASLGTLVNDVNRTRDYVVVERGGLPVAVIMDIDEFEDYLELRDPKARERIATASREHRAGMFVPAQDLLAELQRASPASRGRKQTTAKR